MTGNGQSRNHVHVSKNERITGNSFILGIALSTSENLFTMG